MSAWNPAACDPELTLTNSNLTVTLNTSNAGAYRNVIGTNSHSTGKWYFEIQWLSYSNLLDGIGVNTSWTSEINTGLGVSDSHSAGLLGSGGGANSQIFANSAGTTITGLPNMATGQFIGVAVDVGSRLIWWSINGVYVNGGNPATGANGVNYITTSAVFPAMCFRNSNTIDSAVANFGGNFNTAAPTGFFAWDATLGTPGIVGFASAEW